MKTTWTITLTLKIVAGNVCNSISMGNVPIIAQFIVFVACRSSPVYIYILTWITMPWHSTRLLKVRFWYWAKHNQDQVQVGCAFAFGKFGAVSHNQWMNVRVSARICCLASECHRWFSPAQGGFLPSQAGFWPNVRTHGFSQDSLKSLPYAVMCNHAEKSWVQGIIYSKKSVSQQIMLCKTSIV